MASSRRKRDEKKKFLERAEPDVSYHHTIHFERFFLLTVDIRIDGERVALDGNVKSGLNFRTSRKSHRKIPYDRLLSATCIAGRKYGIDHIGELCYGQVPMFKVFFSGASQVLAFLKSLDKSSYQEQVKSLLSEKKQGADSLSVGVKLYLVVPVGSSDASFVQVTAENHASCLDILHEGAAIDFRKVYPGAEESPVKEVLAVEKHLSIIVELTAEVVQWYSLGLFLRVGCPSLERIKLECGGYTRDGLVPMFEAWVTSCRVSWSDLFQALCRLGYRFLAQKIAAKAGCVMDYQRSEEDWPFEIQPEVARHHLPMLEEREKQMRRAEKDVKRTKEQLKSLSSHVLETENVLQEAVDAAKELADKREELVALLKSKEKQHQEAISRRRNTGKTHNSVKLTLEIEQSICDIREQMEQVDAETRQLDAKKSQMKHQVAGKRRQAKESREALKSHDEQLSQLTAMLGAERTVFDLQVQLMKTSPDNIQEEQAAQITFLREEMKRKDMHRTSLEIYQAHVCRLEQQQQPTLEGDTSRLPSENRRLSSSRCKSVQSLSAVAGLPLYSAVEVPSPKRLSFDTPPHPIPKLTSFKEMTQCSSVHSKRASIQEREEKKKTCEDTFNFEEYDIIDMSPVGGSHSMPNLTTAGESSQSYRLGATPSKCTNSNKEDRKEFLEKLVEEYDIIDIADVTDSPYAPEPTSSREVMSRTFEGSLEEDITDEYNIINLTPKGFTL